MGAVAPKTNKQTQSNTTCLMFFINKMILHCFFQRHVSTLAMSHLQVDRFFLQDKPYN
jgi:hypothetical protein